MSQFIDRMLGAARLDPRAYDSIEHDQQATGQAAAVVGLSALGAAIGALGNAGFGTLIAALIGALIGWFFWAVVVWFIGTRLLPQYNTHADLGQLLRTMGFATSPGILRIFEIIPGLGGLVALVVSIWMLVAMIVAVRQALDFDNTWRAIAVVAIGWLVQLFVLWLIAGAAFFGMDPGLPPEGGTAS